MAKIMKNSVGRPTAKEAKRKQRELLLAAQAEFVDQGYRGASMRRIAERAGVSTRTLYNRYSDKMSLFASTLEELSDRIATEIACPEGELGEVLIAYAINMQRSLSNETSRQMTALIYRDGSEFEELREIASNQFERHQLQPVMAILEREGFPPQDLRELATNFVVSALGKWQRRTLFGGAPLTEAEIIDQARVSTDIFLNGALHRR